MIQVTMPDTMAAHISTFVHFISR